MDSCEAHCQCMIECLGKCDNSIHADEMASLDCPVKCSHGKRCESADNGIFEEEDARVRMARRLHTELKIIEEEDKDLWSLFVQAIHVVEQLENKINDLCQHDEPSGVQPPTDVTPGNSINHPLREDFIRWKRFHRPALHDGVVSDKPVNVNAMLHYKNVTCRKFQEGNQNLSPETRNEERQTDIVQNCTNGVNESENDCGLNGMEDISDKQGEADLLPKDGASSAVVECSQITIPQEGYGKSVGNDKDDKGLVKSEEQVHHNVENSQNKIGDRCGKSRLTNGAWLSDKATAKKYGKLSKNLSRSEVDVRNCSNLSSSRTIVSKLPTVSKLKKPTISNSTVNLSSNNIDGAAAETTAHKGGAVLSKEVTSSKKMNSHVNDTTDQIGMCLSKNLTSSKNLISHTTETSIRSTEEESHLNYDTGQSDTNSSAHNNCPTKQGGDQPNHEQCGVATEKSMNNTEDEATELASVPVGGDSSKSPSKLTTVSRLPTPKFGKTKRLSKSEIDISKISMDSNAKPQLNLNAREGEKSLHYNEMSRSTTDLTHEKMSVQNKSVMASSQNSRSCIAINMVGRRDSLTGKPRSRTGSLLGAIAERSESHRRRLSDNCLQVSGLSRIPHMRRPSVPMRTPGDELRQICDIQERYSGIRPPTITNRIQKWERQLGNK